MGPITYTDETLLNLRENVLYVILKDMGTEAIMAKIISINGRTTFKPNNKTAALLLYLLARDDKDPIFYNDFKSLALEKFSGADVAKINGFLDKLDQKKILKVTTGRDGANDLDPANLFGSNEEPWGDQDPDLIQGDSPITKLTTFFSTGYGPVPIRR